MSFSMICIQLLKGLGSTCLIFALTLLLSLPLGMLIVLRAHVPLQALQYVVRFFISILRGTPLMLQLIVVTFAPFYVFGMKLTAGWTFAALIIGFVINYAAYFAEIYRGGIESIPVGQYEAANVLGYTQGADFPAHHSAAGRQAHHAQHHQRGRHARQGHVHGLHRLLSRRCSPSASRWQTPPDQLHAVVRGGRVLLRVQCHR